MPVKPEQSAIIYTDATQGAKSWYTHKTYGLGHRVTLEMMEDDLYNAMKKMTKELAKAGRNARGQCVEPVQQRILAEYGFPKNGNLEPLIGTTHSSIVAGGPTGSNRATADADLGVASLEAA
jgi:hypothetical protein